MCSLNFHYIGKSYITVDIIYTKAEPLLEFSEVKAEHDCDGVEAKLTI